VRSLLQQACRDRLLALLDAGCELSRAFLSDPLIERPRSLKDEGSTWPALLPLGQDSTRDLRTPCELGREPLTPVRSLAFFCRHHGGLQLALDCRDQGMGTQVRIKPLHTPQTGAGIGVPIPFRGFRNAERLDQLLQFVIESLVLGTPREVRQSLLDQPQRLPRIRISHPSSPDCPIDRARHQTK
jgi:hypothetical protein